LSHDDGILVCKYENIMITLHKKNQENPLKIRFFFKPGIKLLSARLPVGIDIVPPFSTTIQPSASPQAIQKCFMVVQSQCPQVYTCITDNVYKYYNFIG
jgi:hypothetical protein